MIIACLLLAGDQWVTKVTTIKSPPDKEINPSPAGFYCVILTDIFWLLIDLEH